MSAPLDSPGAVRPGEELDRDRLGPYLSRHVPELGELVSVEQFRSGHSNLTYLVKGARGEAVLRRPPFGSTVKGAHDMGREFRVLSHLHAVYSAAPRPLHYCEDPAVLGAPFYLMERIPGVIFRARPPEGLDLDPAAVRACCEAFVDRLADLHGLDYAAAGLDDLRKPGAYVARQVEGWLRRYRDAQTDEVPDFDALARWIAERVPEDSGAVLIHNDYKFDNLVLDPADLTRVVGVLDWEMSTIGDPLTDLGVALSYWLEPGDGLALQAVSCFLTGRPGTLTRGEIAERYGERTGRDVSNILFYYAFGLMKLIVIVQQIYRRYVHGLTRDPRFAAMDDTVRRLSRRAVDALDSGRV